MLLQFKFKNFMSFKDETLLSMVATDIKEHLSTLREANGLKILPVSAIFGANASGKSNIFTAFLTMVTEVIGIKSALNSRSWSFLFDRATANLPSEFEACFIFNQKEYRYGFVKDQMIVHEEWLFEKSSPDCQEKCIFYRHNQTLEVVNETERQVITDIFHQGNQSVLLMTMLGKKKSLYSEVYRWFNDANITVSYANDVEEIKQIQITLENLYHHPQNLAFVKELIKTFDPAITNIEIKKEIIDDNDIYMAYSCHLCDDHQEMWLPFTNESSGTQKMFSLALVIFRSIVSGHTLWIDELDAKIHPLLLRYIIGLFKDKKFNSNNSQLIFSSHNIVCLDATDLRRDEIWFVEKSNQQSILYSLYDFETDDSFANIDLVFGKQYLSGRFGAVPFQNNED